MPYVLSSVLFVPVPPHVCGSLYARDPLRGQIQVGCLAGAVHLSNGNADVPRRAQRGQKPRVEQNCKSSLDLDFQYEYGLRKQGLSILLTLRVLCKRCQKSYHRDNWLVAARLSKCLNLSEEQRAFREVDGLSQNIFLLDLMLNNAKTRLSETHIASLDIVKAIDSVSHGAIYSAIKAIGLPYEFLDYIKNLYEESTTTFCYPGATEQSFHPTCGVRQGDPLSPLLFNAVIEFLIRKVLHWR
ncbi:hypothetical protein JTE90_020752 [Oedothorax gibbosus]|uniref:Reverse transcriptase domain-containing protein n=1 Tax=Oedothorax gibbosus TaxID=931172 RepID=A0AAV6TID8_9ARAC|nr:hypothetical protein JTE90_020752 [Oedothorax gibbosus]